MKDKISIPNPLSLWLTLTPWTKRIIVICFFVMMIVAMITGDFDTLVGIFFDEAKK